MKQLLQVHEDVITVPEVIGKMAEEYACLHFRQVLILDFLE